MRHEELESVIQSLSDSAKLCLRNGRNLALTGNLILPNGLMIEFPLAAPKTPHFLASCATLCVAARALKANAAFTVGLGTAWHPSPAEDLPSCIVVYGASAEWKSCISFEFSRRKTDATFCEPAVLDSAQSPYVDPIFSTGGASIESRTRNSYLLEMARALCSSEAASLRARRRLTPVALVSTERGFSRISIGSPHHPPALPGFSALRDFARTHKAVSVLVTTQIDLEMPYLLRGHVQNRLRPVPALQTCAGTPTDRWTLLVPITWQNGRVRLGEEYLLCDAPEAYFHGIWAP